MKFNKNERPYVLEQSCRRTLVPVIRQLRKPRVKCEIRRDKLLYEGKPISITEAEALLKRNGRLAAPIFPWPDQLPCELATFITGNLSTMLHRLYMLLTQCCMLRRDTPCIMEVVQALSMSGSFRRKQRLGLPRSWRITSPTTLTAAARATCHRCLTVVVYGVGAVLMNVTPDGLERPVAFAYRSLS